MTLRLLTIVAVTAAIGVAAAAWQDVVQGAPVTEVRVLEQRGAPLRIAAAEVVGAGAIQVRVENASREPVHRVDVSAFVVRPDGYLAGSQVQSLNALGGRLDPGGVATGIVSLDGFQLVDGAKVLVAIRRAVTATNTWVVPGAALASLVSAVPIDAASRLAFDLQEEAGESLQAGCGQAWCASEREACKQTCAGAKGVQSFTCQAQTCYSQCVCHW